MSFPWEQRKKEREEGELELKTRREGNASRPTLGPSATVIFRPMRMKVNRSPYCDEKNESQRGGGWAKEVGRREGG